MALCREGVDEKSESINICKRCFHCIKTIRKTPRLAVANNLDFGAIPPELQDLTWAEERVISLYRICVHVLNLRGHESPSQRSEESILHQQLKVKGHAFCVSQDIPSLNGVLPLHPKDLPQILQVSLSAAIHDNIVVAFQVVFLGANRESPRVVRSQYTLKVRQTKIRAALNWLLQHNAAYKWAFENKQLTISEHNLQQYSSTKNGEVPEVIIAKTLYTNDLGDDAKQRAKADSAGYILPDSIQDQFDYGPMENPYWHLTGLADVNAHGLSPELLQDIVNHRSQFVNCSIKPTLVIPSSSNVSLFEKEPHIIHGCFPTLFPYGRGGPYDSRKDPIAMHNYLQHLMRLRDFRFRRHAPFVFALFSLMQRQRASVSASRSLKFKYFLNFQKDLQHITQDTLAHCIEDLKEAEANGEYPRLSHCKDDLARRAFGRLLNQLKTIGGKLPLTDAAKQNARFEVIGMDIKLGIPDLFITVNPNDIHAPLVCHFAGQNVPLMGLNDPDLPENLASCLQRKRLVCSDAMAAVHFSHSIMRAFIKSLLG